MLQGVANLHGNWYVTPYVQTITAMREHAAPAAVNTSRMICQN